MLLQNLHIAGEKDPSAISISGDLVSGIQPSHQPVKNEGPVITFEEAVAIPGLINSHDHLEFNLFPPLGSRIYNNYIEWGADIQKRYRQEIEAVNRVPSALRIHWGICKNLLAGVTTVVNHGKKLSLTDPLIDVFQSAHSLHSVSREPYWKLKLNNPFVKRWPYVIHAGEGTDVVANKEISRLTRWNLLKRDLVAVHGVAMDPAQAEKFKALVWCPASNIFLLGKTAPVDVLYNRTRILFGTDSTLTGHWNTWEQLRLARATGLLSAKELYGSLTVVPAEVWDLHDRGVICPGKKADLVILRSKGDASDFEKLFQSNPEDILLVLKNGEPVLFDESLLSHVKTPGYHSFTINNSRKYINYDLSVLTREIHRQLPSFEFPVMAD